MIKIVHKTLVIVSNMVDQGRIILQNFGLCNLSIFIIFTSKYVMRMRGSRNFRQGGGGGGPGQSDKKSYDNVFFCFVFLLVLRLFNRSQMVNFKEIYDFSRFQRGSNFFQGGVQMLIPYKNPYNL